MNGALQSRLQRMATSARLQTEMLCARFMHGEVFKCCCSLARKMARGHYYNGSPDLGVSLERGQGPWDWIVLCKSRSRGPPVAAMVSLTIVQIWQYSHALGVDGKV